MGAVFSMFGGIYYWFNKITGKCYSEFLSLVHFAIFFVGVNLTFFPMHFLGVAGMPRRIPDYPDSFYMFNKISSIGSYMSILSALFFFYIVIEAFTAPSFEDNTEELSDAQYPEVTETFKKVGETSWKKVLV
jgi:cytochrome c oxidase subunit 1